MRATVREERFPRREKYGVVVKTLVTGLVPLVSVRVASVAPASGRGHRQPMETGTYRRGQDTRLAARLTDGGAGASRPLLARPHATALRSRAGWALPFRQVCTKRRSQNLVFGKTGGIWHVTNAHARTHGYVARLATQTPAPPSYFLPFLPPLAVHA